MKDRPEVLYGLDIAMLQTDWSSTRKLSDILAVVAERTTTL